MNLKHLVAIAFVGLLTLETVSPGLLMSNGEEVRADDVLLKNAERGKSYVVTLDANGNVTWSPLASIVDLGGSPIPKPPQPNPPVPPAPANLTERGKSIKLAADKVPTEDREMVIKALAVLYREVAKLAKDPTKVRDEPALAAGLKKATDDMLMVITRNAAAWQPVRDELNKHWTAVKFRGGSLVDYATLLEEAADGLDASAPNRAIDPAFFDFILKLLAILLPIFFPRAPMPM